MRNPSTPLIVLGGLIFGAAAALAGSTLADDGPAPASPATVTTPTVAPAGSSFRFSPHETVIGPTVLIPTSLSLEEGEVVVGYDLIDIATRPVGSFTRPVEEAVPVAAPERWTLRTTIGDIAGTTSNVRARTARFPVEDGFSLDNIRALQLDSWRVRMPLLHQLEISQADFSEYALDEGTSMTLRRILIQTNNSLVQFFVTHPGDLFTAATSAGFGAAFEAQPQVRGIGPGWTNVGPIEGGTQLTFAGSEIPDPMHLVVRTHSWLSFESPLPIDLEGVFDG